MKFIVTTIYNLFTLSASLVLFGVIFLDLSPSELVKAISIGWCASSAFGFAVTELVMSFYNRNSQKRMLEDLYRTGRKSFKDNSTGG